MIDPVVKNLILSGRNLFPNIVLIEVNNFIKFSLYSDEHHHEIILTSSQMQADMRDVVFYSEGRLGTKITDSDLVDIAIGDEGLTVCFVLLCLLIGGLVYIMQATVHPVASNRDKTSVFKVKSIIVKVDALKFSIRD